VGRGTKGAPAFLVEHYWPAGTPSTFVTAMARLRAAVEQLASAGTAVHLLHATFVPEEGSAFCVFSCSSPELAEEAYKRAGIAFERMLSAVEIEPERDKEPR
jgi:hypothetical protein